MKKGIYLDNAATTRVKQEVLDEMLPFFTEVYSTISCRSRSRHKMNMSRKGAG